MPPKHLIIGLDPGNGNTNACARLGHKIVTASLQSSVARPVDIGQVAKGIAKEVAATRVEWGTPAGVERFVVGAGAWHAGVPTNIVLGDYYHTLPRRALLYAALAQVLPPAKKPEALEVTLVFGLPTNVLFNDRLAALVKQGLTAFKGPHEFSVNGERYAFTVPDRKGSIQVINQPFGAYLDWQLSDDLTPVGQASSVLVFDIGMGTADVAGLRIEGGEVIVERDTILGEDLGVNWLLRAIADEHGLDLAAVDAALRAGRIKLSEDQLTTWLNKLTQMLRDRKINLKRFEVVLPTGGGALLLGERLRLALLARGAAVHWGPGNFLTANVRGYWKHGQRRWEAAQAKMLPAEAVTA